ncbi:Type 4 prepilin-like protein leader peptide-processing enzyme [compost metagenome]
MISIRLPLALKREWHSDAHSFLELPYNHDPAHDAVPLLSFAKGWRFLVIELLCGLVGGVVVLGVGITLEAWIYACLFWGLITVAVIDHETMYIPDAIVLPLAWAGMLFYAFTAPDQLPSHVMGAALAYCLIRWLPVGSGDAKLCAVAGAWIGLEPLLTFLLIGSSLGVAVGLVYWCLRGRSEPFPFGPSLAAALVVTVSMQLMGMQLLVL